MILSPLAHTTLSLGAMPLQNQPSASKAFVTLFDTPTGTGHGMRSTKPPTASPGN